MTAVTVTATTPDPPGLPKFSVNPLPSAMLVSVCSRQPQAAQSEQSRSRAPDGALPSAGGGGESPFAGPLSTMSDESRRRDHGWSVATHLAKGREAKV